MTIPRHKDRVRIVPLATPELHAKPTATAHLVYNNGPLIAVPQVFTVFWGSAWQQSIDAKLASHLNAFFDFILKSALIDQLSEYSVSGFALRHGKRTGTLTLSTPEVGTSVDDTEIRRMLEQQISSGALPKAGADSLYFVFLPSGTAVTMGGSASCQTFCGYHDATSTHVFYAVMPFPDCSGCNSGLSTLDALTVTASHELCEAITDPVPGEGWYDNANGEIGDICGWQRKKIGKYTVQKEWSNRAGKCL